MQLIQDSNVSEVLGFLFADHASLFTASKNFSNKKLGLAFQKICNACV